ncbi:MAG TPA: IPT/TIG domain-containing protein, partial [Vicinamibacteria bacterium]|nr:IPT/TIG domain-containing protein [Vicinamibacteria bacterium]
AAAVTIAAFLAYSRADRPPPVLSGVTPFKAEVGTTITITGSGFETSVQGNVVRFGSLKAAVTNVSPTSLAVTVPEVEGVAAGKNVPVTVEGGGGRSNALFVKIARLPRVTRIEPDVALPGAEVVLHGQNLDGTPLSVKIGGEKVETTEARADSVRVKVPDLTYTDGQSVPVSVEVGTDAARPMPLLLGRLPLVLEVSPSSGPIGERLVVKGRGFDPRPAGNRVTVGGVPALVFTATPGELTAAVPAAEAKGTHTEVPVAVEVNGAPSAGRAVFTLVNPRSGLVRLRFFPAPVPRAPGEGHAFVSTELGPVLLLSGRADAPSTAERAARLAAALTSLVDAAGSRAIAFEVRDGAVPTLAVGGGPALAAVTAEDADGYAQKWDPSLRASRATPRQLASYWAALLQDYVALFGQGQRPYRTAELSPRGKVLVDLYAESQRRGTGGVPVAALASLSPASLRGIRDMALLLPGGTATPGTAVAGRWEGTMADGEAERRIEVRLQVDGGELAGSLTTRRGALQVRTPLQQVTYDKGQLKFVTATGGSTRQFRGTLQGASLSGGIFKDGTARDAVGTFTLRYVE